MPMYPGGNQETTAEAGVHTFADFIGARLVKADGEEVVAELAIEPHHRNLARIVHGGVYMSLLDSAMGLLVSLHYPNSPSRDDQSQHSLHGAWQPGDTGVQSEIHSPRGEAR